MTPKHPPPFAALRHFVAFALLCALAAHCPAAGNQVQLELKQLADKRYALMAYNLSVVPIALDIELQLSGGARSDRGRLVKTVSPPKSTTTLAYIELADRPGAQGIAWRARQAVGDPRAVHDANARYLLPFPPGGSYAVGQAPGGKLTSHKSPQAREAVDITLPRGTPVLAARDGWVIDNVRYFGEGAPAPDQLMRANYVRILHDDGTWAVYAHLDSFSSTLAPGKRIKAGQEIGRSGNSGYSSGPHLHFVVQKNGGAQPVSIPFQFWTASRGAFSPAQGERLAH